MTLPTSQTELSTATEKMKPDTREVKSEIGNCIDKVDSVEMPTGLERLGEALLLTVFPLSGFYFGYRDIKWIIANQPAVREKLEQAKEGTEEILLKLGELLSPGNPFAMKEMAEGWDEVLTHLTGTISPISPESFYATETWTDGLGRGYSRVPSKQKGAVEGVIPHVESMRDFLRTHADTLIQHWWRLAKAIANFYIEAIPLASQFISANPLKWADIAQPIADCIAHILKTVLEVADAIFEFTMTSNGQIESLKEGLSYVTGSEFGKWPKAELA